MTFNHGVEGSSPSALTIEINVQPGDMGNGTYLRVAALGDPSSPIATPQLQEARW